MGEVNPRALQDMIDAVKAKLGNTITRTGHMNSGRSYAVETATDAYLLKPGAPFWKRKRFYIREDLVENFKHRTSKTRHLVFQIPGRPELKRILLSQFEIDAVRDYEEDGDGDVLGYPYEKIPDWGDDSKVQASSITEFF